MNFIKNLWQKDKSNKNSLEETFFNEKAISKTFDEEIKSEESDSKDMTELSSMKKKKDDKSGSGESSYSNSGSSYYSGSEEKSLDEREELLQEYNVIQPNNPGACFSHLSFKILGAFR